MQESQAKRATMIKIAAACVAAGIFAFFTRSYIAAALRVVAGGAVIAFLLEPISRFFERRLARGWSALCALVAGLCLVAALIWLLVPPVTRQVIELAGAIPASIDAIEGLLGRLNANLAAHGIGALNLSEPDLSGLSGTLTSFVLGALNFAGTFAGAVSEFSMMAVLSYFFLRDREKLFLRLELAVPLKARRLAVKMGGAVKREMRLYLRGQMMIAGTVGALSCAGLLLVGVKSSLVLGLVVGIFNMIPYFGPILGSIPAVVMALGDGLSAAVWTVVAMAIVQQIDGTLVSPRIMGNLTGISPAIVLIAVFIGAQVGGVLGMLFALPILMICRTCVRVFVQNPENN